MKVLVIAPSYHGYDRSIADGFARLGDEVAVCSHFPHSTFPQKIRNVLSDEAFPLLGVGVFKQRRIDSFNTHVLSTARAYSPDVVIVVKGDVLHPETVAGLAKRHRAIYWGYDDPYRYPLVVDSLPFYHAVASFSRDDTARLTRDGYNATHVPLGFDAGVFGSGSAQTIEPAPEISFVGARYPRREALLESAATLGSLGIWGGDWKRRPWRRRYFEPRGPLDTAFRGPAGLALSDSIYRSCPVNLNIHGDWDGLNMRVFEIPGAGGFQLCDSGRGIEQLFEPDKEIVLYSNEVELLEKGAYYLAHPTQRARIAEAGQRRANRDHTLASRAKRLLEIAFADA